MKNFVAFFGIEKEKNGKKLDPGYATRAVQTCGEELSRKCGGFFLTHGIGGYGSSLERSVRFEVSGPKDDILDTFKALAWALNQESFLFSDGLNSELVKM